VNRHTRNDEIVDASARTACSGATHARNAEAHGWPDSGLFYVGVKDSGIISAEVPLPVEEAEVTRCDGASKCLEVDTSIARTRQWLGAVQ